MKIHSFRDDQAQRAWPDFTIADEILERLSGFPKYPKEERGRAIFVEALLKCVCEDHARASLDVFDIEFPTLRALRDSIMKTKGRFTPPEIDLIEKWKAEGAEYDPDWWPKQIREVLEAAKKRDAAQLERFLKLGRETEAQRQTREALEAIDGGYDVPNDQSEQ